MLFFKKRFIWFLFVLGLPLQVLAVPGSLTYQGKILKADTTPLLAPNVQFRFKVTADSDDTCVLYEEVVGPVDLSASNGVFDVSFGGSPSFRSAEAANIHDVFKNASTLTCQAGSAIGTYSGAAGAHRNLWVEFNDGSTWNVLNQKMKINAVPYASQAFNATTSQTATNALNLAGVPAANYLSKPGAACVGGVMGFDGSALTCIPYASLAIPWASLTGVPASFTPAAHTHGADEISSGAGKYFTYKPNNVACSNGEFLKFDGTNWICGVAAGGGGSLSDVQSGNAYITASGTTTITLTAQVGTAANTLAAGDDSRIVGALQKAGGTMTGALDMGGQNFTSAGFITMNPSKTLHLSNNAGSPAGLVGADAGKMWYNSVSNKIEYFDGTVVKVVGQGASSADDITSLVGTGIVQRNGAGSYSTVTVNAPLTYAAGALGVTVGMAAGTLAAGDDARIVGALQTSGGTMTGNLYVGGDIRVNGSTSGFVGLRAPASGGNATFVLPGADGTSGQVLSTNGSGVLSWTSPSAGMSSLNGQSGGSQTFANGTTGTAPAFASSGDVHTLNIPMAATAGTTAGLISKTQYDAFNAKATASGWANYSVIGTNGSGAMAAVSGTVNGSILQHSATGPVFSTAAYPSTTTANQLLYSSATNVVSGLATVNSAVLLTNGSGVPAWTAQTTDTFSQYALLAGRTTGQTLRGGANSGADLILDSTAHATKGDVVLNPTGGAVGVGTASPDANAKLTVSGTMASPTNVVTTGGVVNLSLSSFHYLKSVGGSTITLSNAVNGGVYTIVVSDTTSRTYSFSGCATTKFSPASAATTAGTETIFSITTLLVDASMRCYVTWASEFQ